MSRVFGYCRVSTADQDVSNQIAEIAAAGFTVDRRRVVTDVISGSTPAAQRPGFQRLLDRTENGDVLVVTKLDRLGRDAIDVAATVKRLEADGVHVHCLALGGMDLTSPAGKMTMGVIAAVAEFERDLLIERTNAGLKRAKSQGKRLGRPSALNADQKALARAKLAAGASVASVAKGLKTSRMTIMRIRDGEE